MPDYPGGKAVFWYFLKAGKSVRLHIVRFLYRKEETI